MAATTLDETLPEILITERDHERLMRLLGTLPPRHVVGDLLRRELDRADVVESHEIPSDVVTMHSHVVLEDAGTQKRHTVTLVYPGGADFQQGRLSILAPVGAALLGLRAGAEIAWPMPDGSKRLVRVVSVDWQPEAAGDFSL
ncbi:MAG: nucleoside diphosphate kinase regulator [Myxococcota bacterium]